MSIHYLLKAGRRESGYSLREAAAMLSLTPSTLYRYEEGYIRKIRPETRRQLLLFYFPYILRLYDRLQDQKLRLECPAQPLEMSEVTPEYLYSFFWSADDRGKQAILRFLQLQHRQALGEEAPEGFPDSLSL